MRDCSVNKDKINSLSLYEKIRAISIIAVISELMSFLFFDIFWGFVLTPMVYVVLKNKLAESILERKKREIRNEFRDVLYAFSSSFATGRHMIDAISEAISILEDLYSEQSYLLADMKKIHTDILNSICSDIEALKNLAMKTGIEDISDFAAVYGGCRHSGGNMIKAVDRAAKIITEKINIEGEIRKMAYQKKNEGRIIGFMPIAIIVFLRLSAPDYISIMYETLAGRLLMFIALITIIAALYMTEYITKIEV